MEGCWKGMENSNVCHASRIQLHDPHTAAITDTENDSMNKKKLEKNLQRAHRGASLCGELVAVMNSYGAKRSCKPHVKTYWL
jgi:hypothetical protein